ncbi:epoxide hydrolase 2 [Apiospora aurea]|uniref:Epoxide hydrolase 2 n=1 Tax=Apiospora aurea TaxID=335848 RepID=A0ABR1QY62_9PEZI
MHQPNIAQTAAAAAAAVAGGMKGFTTGDGTNYVYDYSPAANETLSTFLLLHGYPSSCHSWRHQLAALAQLGYGVLAPDLLGMGDSDKPTHVEAYRSKRISGHLTELLDHESLGGGGRKVIGVGHDWGVAALSKVAVWYPDRFSGLVFLNSAYFPPGVFFDLDAINRKTLGTLGYARYGYWYFFNSFDAGPLISEKLKSFFHLLYHTDAAQWGQNFANIGSARAWLQANKTQPLPAWLTEEDKARWLHLYSQPNAAEASLSYYRAVMRGIFDEDEDGLRDEDRVLKVPVVAIQAAKDQVSTAEDMTAVT